MQQQLGAGLCAPQELLSTLSRQGSFSGGTGTGSWLGAAGLVQGGGAQNPMQQQQQQGAGQALLSTLVLKYYLVILTCIQPILPHDAKHLL